MPVQQNIAGHQFRRVLFVKDVSVRQEEQMTSDFHQGIIRQNREVQHHLVYFRFAVAADTENAVCHGIQHRNHSFRIVALRKIIPWAMIENVAKKNQAVRLFAGKCFQKLTGIKFRPVEV